MFEEFNKGLLLENRD